MVAKYRVNLKLLGMRRALRLYSLTLNGYRRLAGGTWINLQGRVVAIVGPNEAGKSSVLSALDMMNRNDAVPATALTRGSAIGPSDVVAYLRLRLDPGERAMAPSPLQDDEAIWLLVQKTAGGPRRYVLEPAPIRNKAPRIGAIAMLEAARTQPWLKRLVAADEDEATEEDADDDEGSLPERLSDLSLALEQSGENAAAETMTLLETAIGELGSLDQSVTSKSSIRSIDRLIKGLRDALEAESLPHPTDLANRLQSRVPTFLDFDDENRSLRSEYDLANPEDAAAPALVNLAAVADLSIPTLQNAINANDVGRIRSLLESAQSNLNTALEDAWKQSSLSVSFDLQGSALRVTVSSHGTDYFSLDDRSEGLKTFIALRVFLARRTDAVAPILLVDEADSHLHYDAQADIIRVFEQQAEVAQVIYTTHSIGCLPQDLGRGVRVVIPEEVGTRSVIENVWSRGSAGGRRSVGITPLMLAMGASTVPLTPTRFVVVAEGPSDAMLLPSLLREATDLDVLGYQVVGGLSEANEDELKRLTYEASRVAYLVDGDAGGDELHARLRGIGIPAKRIVRWGAPKTGLCLEDAIHPDLYVAAINRSLVGWPPNKAGFTTAALTASGRPAKVAAWCRSAGVTTPSKVQVAQEALAILDDPLPDDDVRLSDSSKTTILRRLHDRIGKALELPVA